MRNALTILTAFVLLVASFTFSSCKSCKKDNSDGGTAGNAALDNPSSDNARIDGDTQTIPTPRVWTKKGLDNLRKIAKKAANVGDGSGLFMEALVKATIVRDKGLLFYDHKVKNFVRAIYNLYFSRRAFALEIDDLWVGEMVNIDKHKSEAEVAEKEMDENKDALITLDILNRNAPPFRGAWWGDFKNIVPEANKIWKELLDAVANVC
jgi:hypothetical protein